MSMSVSNIQRSRGNANYNTKAFRQVWEDHIGVDLNLYINNILPLNARQMDKYRGDFYGLLIELRIPEELHWFTLRINSLHSPSDFCRDVAYINTLHPNTVRTVLERYLSSKAQL